MSEIITDLKNRYEIDDIEVLLVTQGFDISIKGQVKPNKIFATYVNLNDSRLVDMLTSEQWVSVEQLIKQSY